MSNKKHTPGPWVLTPDPNGWTLESNGASVTAKPFDSSDNDARLIAAAPDLLAACKLALANFEAHADGLGCQAVLRAAIAKAEGR